MQLFLGIIFLKWHEIFRIPIHSKRSSIQWKVRPFLFFLVAQLDFSTSFWDPSFFGWVLKRLDQPFWIRNKNYEIFRAFCAWKTPKTKIWIFWRDFDHPGLLENPPLFSWMVFKPRWGSSPFTFLGASESPWGGQSADRRGDRSDHQIKSWMYGSSELFTRVGWLLVCKCPRFIRILKGGGGGDSPNLP